jgi:membrane associated rhomboid family serine protease
MAVLFLCLVRNRSCHYNSSMLLPIRTSISPRRTPYINYALIVVNAAIFLLSFSPHRDPYTGDVEYLRPWAQQLVLDPTPGHLYLWQFVSYAFLHASYMHIIGNMFFLYLFGNNVNDKLGHIGYLCFYLAGAVFSGIGHILVSNYSVLGASGAVAAVTGAYLVLFPQTLITVLYWLIFIGTIELPAMYFIAFKLIIWDNMIEPRFGPPISIAHGAHLAGYSFGIAAILLLLATKLISGNHLDLWAMIKRWNRRRRYRDVVSSGYDPYTGQQTKQIKVKEVIKSAAEQRKEAQIHEIRGEISSRLAQRNLSAAAQAYIELMRHDGEQILPRQQLLDIANQLAGENKYAESAHAYEQFLTHYRNYEYAEQVELMLGVLYSRYLNQTEPAIKHLKIAAEKLSDPGQLKMCKDELARLQA